MSVSLGLSTPNGRTCSFWCRLHVGGLLHHYLNLAYLVLGMRICCAVESLNLLCICFRQMFYFLTMLSWAGFLGNFWGSSKIPEVPILTTSEHVAKRFPFLIVVLTGAIFSTSTGPILQALIRVLANKIYSFEISTGLTNPTLLVRSFSDQPFIICLLLPLNMTNTI